jgi:putative sigma-54 modulation protein
MDVRINTQRFTADKKLTDHVNGKIQKLSTFHDRITTVDVFLKLDNVVHNIKDKVAEIKVHIPGHTFFVKNESKTFEESFDESLQSMTTQIKRHKEKAMAVH